MDEVHAAQHSLSSHITSSLSHHSSSVHSHTHALANSGTGTSHPGTALGHLRGLRAGSVAGDARLSPSVSDAPSDSATVSVAPLASRPKFTIQGKKTIVKVRMARGPDGWYCVRCFLVFPTHFNCPVFVCCSLSVRLAPQVLEDLQTEYLRKSVQLYKPSLH